MTDLAAAWLAKHHPGEESLPTDDTGRSHRDVSLTELPYCEPPPAGRPNTHRSPAWRQREALESQAVELAEREAVRLSAVAADPCSHCHARPVKYRRQRLCARCYTHRARHGRLPSVQHGA